MKNRCNIFKCFCKRLKGYYYFSISKKTKVKKIKKKSGIERRSKHFSKFCKISVSFMIEFDDMMNRGIDENKG